MVATHLRNLKKIIFNKIICNKIIYDNVIYNNDCLSSQKLKKIYMQ